MTQDIRGLVMSLRDNRPIVIETPDGKQIEIVWARNTRQSSRRDVFLKLPEGYLAHKGDSSDSNSV